MIDILKRSLFSDYDVVHCDVFSGQTFWVADIVRKIAIRRKKRVIMNLQGGRFLDYLGETARRLNTYKNWTSTGIAIISPSSFLARGLKGLCNAEVQIVPNFIDLRNFPYKPNSRTGTRLLWVRAFNDVYQPEIAIEALADLRKKHRSVWLTMVGPDKGKLPVIRDLIGRLDLGDCVEITGPIPNEKLHEYFSTHDVYLNTTAYESFGLAVFEAASCGIPIVSTCVGELPFIWKDYRNIIFVKNQSGGAFADTVCELFENRSLMEAIRVDARAVAERYSWVNVEPVWRRLLS
jgi:glycosyltransferase involved in cell wall biosynthesis